MRRNIRTLTSTTAGELFRGHALRAVHPDITVELLEGSPATLEEMVVNGAVDLAFRPLQPKTHDSTLSHRTIWSEDIVAVMKESDDLADGGSVSIDDLIGRRLIGDPSGSEKDGGGLDLRNSLGGAAEGLGIAYPRDAGRAVSTSGRVPSGIQPTSSRGYLLGVKPRASCR
ncbi:MAG TPA: substrate-binding domain-containing protein [Galbitalea sp.]